jgi:hypothetical protein
MSIIKHESGGSPGIAAKVNCKCGPLPKQDGSEKTVCTALGLMQVIPATVAWYNNQNTGDDIATFEDMLGEDERAIRIQIRTGCMFLAFANRYLHNKFPETMPETSLANASDDQIKLALSAYLVGNGATADKMRTAKNKNYLPTFANIKKLFPTWGQNASGTWINQPLKYAQEVLTNYRANRGGSYSGTKPGDLIARIKTGNKGGIIALALVLAASGWAINRHYTRPKD